MYEANNKTLKRNLASRILYDDLAKKEQEAKILEGFLSRLQIAYKEYDTEHEKPDAFVHCENAVGKILIGCEITSYYLDGKQGSAEARFFRLWQKFAEQLRWRLDEIGDKGRFLYGAIHFKYPSWDVLDKFDQDQLIQEILNLVTSQSKISELKNFSASKPVLLENVDHIYLKNTYGEEGIFWWPAHLQSGEIMPCSERLKEIINKKNQSASLYDWKNADERWLLIYAGARSLADTIVSEARFSNQLEFQRLNFSRIYLWNKFMGSISEIYPGNVSVYAANKKVLRRRDYPAAVRRFVIGKDDVGRS